MTAGFVRYVYYPFGMEMMGRNYKASSEMAERFGYNGQMKSEEIAGTGNHNTALFWEYDTRLGRRWNLDPKAQIFISDYASFGNNPLTFNDPLGDELRGTNKQSASREAEIIKGSFVGKGTEDVKGLFQLKENGVEFERIDPSKLDEATRNLPAEQTALAYGYAAMINSTTEVHTVEVVKKGEELSPEALRRIGGLGIPDADKLSEWGGGVTLGTFSAILMNNTQGHEVTDGKKVFTAVPNAGELSFHEVIGHQMGNQIFGDQASGVNLFAVRASNIYLKANGMSYYRTGSDHDVKPGENVRLSTMQIESILRLFTIR